MDIYPRMSLKKEDCHRKGLSRRMPLNNSVNVNLSTKTNSPGSVYKRALRRIPNILKNSRKLRRISTLYVIKEMYGKSDGKSEQAAENSVLMAEDKKEQEESVACEKQEVPPQEAISSFDREKEKLEEDRKKLENVVIRDENEGGGEASVVVNEQKVVGAGRKDGTDFSADFQTASLFQEVDEIVMQGSIDYTGNEIFNLSYYDLNTENDYLDPNANRPVFTELDSSYNIRTSFALDINDNECDEYQTIEDKNEGSNSIYRSIFTEHWGADSDTCCECCVGGCFSDNSNNSSHNKKENLLVENEDSRMDYTHEDTSDIIQNKIDNAKENSLETVDKDSPMNNANVDTSMNPIQENSDTNDANKDIFINLPVEEDSHMNNNTSNDSTNSENLDLLLTDIDSLLREYGDSNETIAGKEMFDTVTMDSATEEKDECSTLCESCGVLFTERDMFEDHTDFCGYEKLFRCDTCKRIFRFRSSMIRHMKLMHSRTIQSTNCYICGVCARSYRKFRPYKAHVRSHRYSF